MTTAQEAIDVLNRIHATDPKVLATLIGVRVPCNEALADDPTVQVKSHEDGYRVGILGVINGLFGTHEKTGRGLIAAYYDNDHNLVRFELTEPNVDR